MDNRARGPVRIGILHGRKVKGHYQGGNFKIYRRHKILTYKVWSKHDGIFELGELLKTTHTS